MLALKNTGDINVNIRLLIQTKADKQPEIMFEHNKQNLFILIKNLVYTIMNKEMFHT